MLSPIPDLRAVPGNAYVVSLVLREAKQMHMLEIRIGAKNRGIRPIVQSVCANIYCVDPREEVIQAWYMDDSDADQRLPHHRDPQEFVSFEKLDASKIVSLSFSELGVLSWRLDADNYETDPKLKKIREDRGYSYMDFCEVCPEKLPNYEEKIKNFYEEHLHTDEEIRYCVAGSGYFDVRDRDEAWIRIWVKKGAMIVLPAGIYHRFTLDSDNYIKAMRLFVGDPVWTPFNRPHDHLPARKEYVDNFVNKAGGGPAVDAAAA
ncbi:hypothetical protein SASPL_103860 [Salvia splendens]|uniref:Acireductone dioxygenase n=1 Tax=Salvia splendens TaxID=180675 RepID=A0A8X8YG27_SALSN|nr:hypothetical protein SASPL_103860 [Salvia splendens]